MRNADPTNINPVAGRLEMCEAEYADLGLPGAIRTGGRFNLLPLGRRHGHLFARDIILPTGLGPEGINPEKGGQRLLVLDKELVDLHIYRQLQDARIPQLPVIRETENLAIFGVPRGARLLRHEPFHGTQSSPTYIGDGEIYQEAGRLYGAAWQATGEVLVDGPEDSPASHLAIVSFSDDAGHYLFFCPPYGGGIPAGSADDARALFLQTLPNRFGAAAGEYSQELIAAAATGFGPLQGES